MRRKGIKDKNKAHELELSERELFLDAFYQQSESAAKPKKTVPKKGASYEVEDDRALFLRTVELLDDFWLKRDERPQEKKPTKRRKKSSRSSVAAELDLHGMFVEHAIEALFRFLDRETHRGSRTVLIVHGKGTGILKNVVRSCLSTHPYVEDFFLAGSKMGGEGAIMVRLKRSSND